MRCRYVHGSLVLWSSIIEDHVWTAIWVDLNILDGIMTITPSVYCPYPRNEKVLPLLTEDVMPQDAPRIISGGFPQDWRFKFDQNHIIDWRELTTLVPQRIMLCGSMRPPPTGHLAAPPEGWRLLDFLRQAPISANLLSSAHRYPEEEVTRTLAILLNVREIRYSWSKSLDT